MVGLPVPSTFAVKDNWFFENFLTPLLYINIDVTGQIPDSADRIVVKRLIANTVTDEQKIFLTIFHNFLCYKLLIRVNAH
jgi:hypothetical protein